MLEFLKGHYDGKNPLLKEIITKLSCMVDVGLFHLALSRPVPSLSGGEIQRLFLASYIIAEMDSIIFVFDEPTIGLHEVEKENLIRIIRRLVDHGNTAAVVEHDENFIREADYIIDMGSDAGIFDRIRDLFAESDGAKKVGYSAGMFSVNSKGGCPRNSSEKGGGHWTGY